MNDIGSEPPVPARLTLRGAIFLCVGAMVGAGIFALTGLSLARTGGFPCFSQIDERGAGFFALGLARATGRPAVLACTSGTWSA